MPPLTYAGSNWTRPTKKFAAECVKEVLAKLPPKIHAPIVIHNKPAMNKRHTFVGCYWANRQLVEAALMPDRQYQQDVLLHELGHHYWYTHMTEDERNQFTSWVNAKSRPLPLTFIRNYLRKHNCLDLRDLEDSLIRNNYTLWLRVWHVVCTAKGWEHTHRRPRTSAEDLMTLLEEYKTQKVFLYPFSCVCLYSGGAHVSVEIYAEAFEWFQHGRPLPAPVLGAFLSASGDPKRYQRVRRGVVGEFEA